MIHAMIMAGGSGTRFWPLSRELRPKQFLAIGGDDQTLLEATAERILPMCVWDRLLVVASGHHAQPIRKLLPDLPRGNLLLEPAARNTAPAVGLAALEVHMRDPQGVLVVLPSDHVIRPAGKFRTLIRAACRAAKSGAIITLGIAPTRPETGYGYIRVGRKLEPVGKQPLFDVDCFTEKPDHPKAVSFLQQGGYFWNSGMFVFRADAMLQAIASHLPDLHAGLERVRAASKGKRKRVLSEVFENLNSVSIDHGIMEKVTNIQMLPCELFWSDVGSWAALPEVMQQDQGNNVYEGDALLLSSRGCVVHASSRLVACVGLKDLVVVETPDAVLVCPVSEAQAVRQVVDRLRQEQRKDVL